MCIRDSASPAVAAPRTAGWQPAGPPQGMNGCLKAFLIVFGILVVLGIAAFVVLGFVVKKGVDSVSNDIKAEQKVENSTGIKSNPLGFNSKHPPQDDISASGMTCTTDSQGNMQASGTVTNHSSSTSTYTISISFRRNGAEIASGSDLLPSVDAGQTATWTANSAVSGDGGPFTCKITEIDRFSIGTLIPTTTTR